MSSIVRWFTGGYLPPAIPTQPQTDPTVAATSAAAASAISTANASIRAPSDTLDRELDLIPKPTLIPSSFIYSAAEVPSGAPHADDEKSNVVTTPADPPPAGAAAAAPSNLTPEELDNLFYALIHQDTQGVANLAKCLHKEVKDLIKIIKSASKDDLETRVAMIKSLVSQSDQDNMDYWLKRIYDQTSVNHLICAVIARKTDNIEKIATYFNIKAKDLTPIILSNDDEVTRIGLVKSVLPESAHDLVDAQYRDITASQK